MALRVALAFRILASSYLAFLVSYGSSSPRGTFVRLGPKLCCLLLDQVVHFAIEGGGDLGGGIKAYAA